MSQGVPFFTGRDAIDKKYRTRALIAEMVAALGPPPPEFLKRGKRSSEFFTEDGEYLGLRFTTQLPEESDSASTGQWKGEIPIPELPTLEECERELEAPGDKAFLQFLQKALRWRPEDRFTARQLLWDPWLMSKV